MNKTYGYIRISRKEQNPERQQRNILQEYPNAEIHQEAFTGTQIDGRKVFEALRKDAMKGDTIVFDSVSRMSRNAEQGIEVYEELYARGVNLVFLKEHHIDTSTYRKALDEGVPMTGTNVDIILKAINDYLKVLRREQIIQAFAQAQKEVDDLHQRTKEGIETVKRRNKRIEEGREQGEIKRIGGEVGRTLITKKSIDAKEKIKKYSRDFGGMLTDKETMHFIGIASNTFYKYKKQLLQESETAKK